MKVPPKQIVGDRIKLRAVRRDDLEDIHAYASDPEVCRMVHWGPNENIEETEKNLNKLLEVYESGEADKVNYAIERLEDGRFLGRCSIHDDESDEVHVSIVLNSDYWGLGFGAETLGLLFKAAKRDYGFKRVVAKCHVDNVASAKMMQKAGMKYVKDVKLNKVPKDLSAKAKLYEKQL